MKYLPFGLGIMLALLLLLPVEADARVLAMKAPQPTGPEGQPDELPEQSDPEPPESAVNEPPEINLPDSPGSMTIPNEVFRVEPASQICADARSNAATHQISRASPIRRT